MNDVLKNVVKIGTCEAGLCKNQAVAEISLDKLHFDPDTLEARAQPVQIKICMKHKSEYFKYQDQLMDKINPERKANGKRKAGKQGRPTQNMEYSTGFAKRFRDLSQFSKAS